MRDLLSKTVGNFREVKPHKAVRSPIFRLISLECRPGDREFPFTLNRQSDGCKPLDIISVQCPIIDHHFVDQSFEVSGTAAFIPSEL